MVKPHIHPVTLDIACPTCQQSQFTIFRRDPEAQGLSLNHCKCACGQLFVYYVDDSNRPVLDHVDTTDARSRERSVGRDHLRTIFCPQQ